MATSHATIETALLVLYNDAKAIPMTEATFADRMATIIQNAILSADLDGLAPNVQSGGTDRVLTGGLL
ncbi:MAG: hypothetical protein KAR42_15115 [candidate division Zixibacteria bacterium]|nr:hypothetical protein [candidate division Zixibacteria bacterium]